jgi:hypothetical protein
MDSQLSLSKESRSAFLKVSAVIVAGFLLLAFAAASVARVSQGEGRPDRFAQGR